ncbi:MAG: FecR domain-containing protein [Magnetococcales bacterium]|nr:FecR domain-containing protein [Magnetococcales bacterium]MBF0322900.1 FecR domain-containing protein [Magnetococcales bacterium]
MSKSVYYVVVFLLLGLFVGIAPARATSSPEAIGHIKKLEGSVKILRASKTVDAKLGDEIFMNDTLKSGTGAAMGVTFKDDTRVALGPDTEFVVDDFVYQPQKNKLSFGSRITKGTLQVISGTIAKLSPQSVKLETPTGTIGVRGTRFLVKVGK